MTPAKSSIDSHKSPTLPAPEALHEAVHGFDSLSLEEMDRVKMMDRFDRKFVFNVDQLPWFLQLAASSYKVLQINSERIFPYASTYFDSSGLSMYLNHHNQKRNRYKIRKREYQRSGEVFLEIKHKTNKGLTRKKRITIENRSADFVKDEKKFLKKNSPFKARILSAVLQNSFCRITLAHKHDAERITIDFELSFNHGGASAALPFVAIAEIKREKSSGMSDFEKILRQNKILPMKFSKYCIGMVLLNPAIKHNRFKQKLITIYKLNNHSSYAPFYN